MLWKPNTNVIVKMEDNVWRKAVVIDTRKGEVFAENLNGRLWVDTKYVRSAVLPADAMNLID